MNLKNPKVALIVSWTSSKVLGASPPDTIQTDSVRRTRSSLRMLGHNKEHLVNALQLLFIRLKDKFIRAVKK